MSGLSHLSWHVEMKNGLCSTSPLLCEPPPAGVSLSSRTMASRSEADKINVDMIFVGRPMLLEIIKKEWPVEQEPMLLEIAHRKGESVVDAD